MSIPSPEPTSVYAWKLTGEHIGELIRFRLWNSKTEVSTVITAELRQVNHMQGHVTIAYGVGAESQAELASNAPVIINPSRYYSDVSQLLGNDPREADQEAAARKARK